MATYLHPGVYVEEIPSGAKPIEGVATSVAAFVGAVRKGPVGEPILIHSWDDYVRNFGAISSNRDYMGLAVSAFYLNGGKNAYIARLVSTSPPAAASSATINAETAATGAVLTISASSVGEWGDEVYFRIKKPQSTDLAFTLEVGHQEDLKFVADETFKGLVMNARSDDFAVTKVNGSSQLVRLALAGKAADPTASDTAYVNATLTGAAADAAADFFSKGFKDKSAMSLNLDGRGVKQITLRAADVTLTGTNKADGEAIAAAIVKAVKALGPQKSYQQFAAQYGADRKFVLTSGIKDSYSSVVVYEGDKSETDLAHFLKLDSAASPAAATGASNVIPAAVPGTNGQGAQLTGGKEGAPTSSEYKTFFSTKLKKVPDASIVVLPGQSMPASGAGNPIIAEALAHAEDTRSRMVIIDPAADAVLDQAATVTQMGLPTSTYAVLYYPWVKIANPLYRESTAATEPETLTIAPSAFAAGMWSKIDGPRGVWKAPAGVETALLGVSGLKVNVGEGDQDQLNPLGVNCIRSMPGFGSVIWGARTLATQADPEWRYVPIRRTAIMIERSIYNGIQWAVFEPNNHNLWASLRVNIGGFMDGLFRSGAFQGEKAGDAYFVRCGLGDTMTQDDIDRGQVIVIVGFAPLKPAEFVIVRIQQKVGQQ